MNNYQAQGRARMCRKTFAIAEDLGRRLCDAKKRGTADGLPSMYQRSSKTGSIMDQTGTPNRRRGSSIPYKRSPSRGMQSWPTLVVLFRVVSFADSASGPSDLYATAPRS